MPEKDDALERLLEDEREACGRYERLAGPQLPIADKALLRETRKLCDEAKRAVQRYKQRLLETWRNSRQS